ncbi:hypothetical protein Mapa_005969 [Marchantia paleacea]|nr:hypothetical protein Mapa_005969 [Marchantia paleacea]
MAGSGDTKWVAATVFATVMGYVIIWGLFNQFIDNNYANYVQALLYCVAMFLSVCGCGGAVMFFWDRSIKNRTLKASTQDLVQKNLLVKVILCQVSGRFKHSMKYADASFLTIY